MMKKILLIAVVAMMATMNVNAQSDEPKNEVGIFYGIGAGMGQGVGLVLSKIGLDHYTTDVPAAVLPDRSY